MSKHFMFLIILFINSFSQNNFIITEQHQYAANKYRSIGIVSFSVEDQQTEACRQDFSDKLISIIAEDNRKFKVQKMDITKDRLSKMESLEISSGHTLNAALPSENNLGNDNFKPELLLIISQFTKKLSGESGSEASKSAKEQMTLEVSYVLWDNTDGHVVAYGITAVSLEKGKGGYKAKKLNKALLLLSKTTFENMVFIKNK